VDRITDQSAQPFPRRLAQAVHPRAEALNRRIYLMAEWDLNDARFIRGPELGRLGLDVHWNDDFRHALHRLLTG
jgi:maltooligosyltrehalose trehalohydrolase